MGAEDHDRTFRYFCQLFHKHGTLGTERVHHMPTMDDFVSNIDRRPILLERESDNIDRPVDSRPKPSWIGEIDLHSCHVSLTRYRARPVRHVLTGRCCPPYVRAAGSVNTIGPRLISPPISRTYSFSL